jgi:hypothetical protein
MNGGELWFGRVEDGLNLGLLVGRQVQFAREVVKAECVVTVPARGPRVSLGLSNDKTAKRDGAGSRNC